jgi:hypothetical protein
MIERSHDWIDRRSLAFDLAIAAMVRAQPDLLRRAQVTVDRWIEQRRPAVPAVLLQWQEILSNWPLERILDLLTSFEEEPRRLRQSSPFCGILPRETRLAILKKYEAELQTVPSERDAQTKNELPN